MSFARLILHLFHLVLKLICLLYSDRKVDVLFCEFKLVPLKAISLSVFFYLLLKDPLFLFQPKLLRPEASVTDHYHLILEDSS